MKGVYMMKILAFLFLLACGMSVSAQKFYDNSLFYSITNKLQDNKIYHEEYKLYLDKQGFQPYLLKNNFLTKARITTKGESFHLFEDNNAIYLKYEDGRSYSTQKIFSLVENDTVDVFSEIPLPMLVMFYGEKAVYQGVENVSIYGEKYQAYKFFLYYGEIFQMTVHLKKDDLIPLKYEMEIKNRFTKKTKHNLLVELDRISGSEFEGNANVTFLGKDADLKIVADESVLASEQKKVN